LNSEKRWEPYYIRTQGSRSKCLSTDFFTDKLKEQHYLGYNDAPHTVP
jgi:hypothetical protein